MISDIFEIIEMKFNQTIAIDSSFSKKRTMTQKYYEESVMRLSNQSDIMILSSQFDLLLLSAPQPYFNH